MPLTREQRRRIVEQNGFDPATHDYDEAQQSILNYPGGVPQELEASSEPVLTPPALESNSSALGTLGRGAAQSLGPSFAGLGLGALGAKAGLAIGGPPGGLIGGIGGAIGGGLLGSKLQDAVVPDSIKQDYFLRPEDMQEHPIAATIGELAPSMLAMNPISSAKAVGRAGSLVGRMITSPSGAKALTAAEMAALKSFGLNAGINAGVQGGLNVAGQMQSDQPFSIGSLAGDVALGGLLNEPTKLGRKLFGFQPSFDGVPTRGEVEAARRAQLDAELASQARQTSQAIAEPPALPVEYKPRRMVEGFVQPEPSDVITAVQKSKTEKLYPGGKETAFNPVQEPDLFRPYKSAADSAGVMGEAYARGERPANPMEVLQAREVPSAERDLAFRKLEAENQRSLELAAQAEAAAEKLRIENDTKSQALIGDKVPGQGFTRSHAEKLIAAIQGNSMAKPEMRPAPVTTKLGNKMLPDYTKNLTKDAAIAKAESDSAAELIQKKLFKEKYQEKSKNVKQFDTLEEEIKNLMSRRGIKPGAYRVDIKDAKGNPILGEKSGQPVAGMAQTKSKTVSLGKEAGADTAYHETGHVYLDEMARSLDPKDRELVSKAFAEVGHPEVTAEEFVRWNDEYSRTGDETVRQRFIDAEEKLMDYIGFEGAKKNLSGEKGKEYLKDTLARFGAGENSAQRKLLARMENDAPQGEYKVGEKNTDAGTNLKFSGKDEEKIETPKLQEKSTPIEENPNYNKKSANEFEENTKRKETSELEDDQQQLKFHLEQLKYGLQHENVSKELENRWKKDWEKQLSFVEAELSRRSGRINKFQEKSTAIPAPDELSAKKPFLNLFTSVTDKIRAGKQDSKAHDIVSKSAKDYFDEKSVLEGRYGNAILDAQKGYSSKEVERVYQYRWAKDAREATPFELTAKERELDAKLQPLIERPKIDAKEIGLNVKRGDEWKPPGISKNGYLPNQMDPKFLDELTTNPNSIESKRIKRVWGEWLKKKGADNPEEMIKNWELARRDYGDTSGPEFAALRKPEGFGLPWELMEKNPARAWKRYARRAAADVSFFKHMQSKDEIRAALGIKSQQGENPKDVEGIEYIGSEKDVQKMMKFVYGNTASQFPRIEAFGRTIGSMIMGPGTAIRNLAGVPAQLSSMDVKMKDVFKGLSNLGKIKQEAFEQNVTRPDYAEFDRYSDYDSPDSVVNTLDKLSAFFRKWQGRDLSDKYEGEIIYAIGKEWAATKITQAKAGNSRATRLLERVGNLSERTESGNIEATEENLKKLATGFVNVVRGSYGPQGLPAWALEGNIAPFVALSKYSIERWNNVYKDVITPLKSGNALPFLKYTMASLIGGAGIEELNQLLSNRKGPELDINETLAAYAKTQDPELIASKVIGLAQLSAYAGIVGDMAKMTERAISGKDMKFSNPLSYPAYTFATETIASNLSQAVGAIREGEDPIEILAEFAKVVGTQTIQGARYASNRINEKDTQRKEEFSDLRKFREATGGETTESQSSPDEFKNLGSKKFKRTEDINEAGKELPGLIQAAFEKAGNDPYKLKAELRKLKQNSYQSMPAPETQPIEFYDYLNYLRQTQGEEKAAQRLSKFLGQRQVNQLKAKMVP